MERPPCYNYETKTDCPKRAVGCHSKCYEWAIYKKAKAVEDKKRRQQREADRAFFDHYKAVEKRKERVRKGNIK